jgi:hypothetical protein
MTRLGIINNVLAGRNQSRLERIRALVRATGGECREVTDLASIRSATLELADRDVDVMAINGGDGTAQAAITTLMHRDGPMPDIAIVPGGTTNMTANDLNDSAPLEAALGVLAGQAARPPEQRTRISRPLIRAQAPGIEPQFGLFMGAGIVLKGMQHFRDHVGSKGLRGELAAGISLLYGLAGIARARGPWSDTAQATVRFGQAPPWREQILVMATTLERLFLGLRPWWDDQAAAIHLTAMRRAPRALLRLAPALLKGRRDPRMSPENGYRSANVDAFSLQVSDGFAMDGQIFALAADQTAVIDATPPIEFLSLREDLAGRGADRSSAAPS